MTESKIARKRVRGKRRANANSPFLCCVQVLELVPVSQAKLYVMIAEGEFPKPKKISTRAVAWSKAEVDAWINEKLA